MFNNEIKTILLKEINSHLASFKCGADISGFIQTSEKEVYTVVLDGGDVLGAFNSPSEAISTINTTADLLSDYKENHGPYGSYKRAYYLFNFAFSLAAFSHHRGH
jgi:hypothetical protein